MQQSTRPDTRAALVQAAQRLIAEKGLGTVSVKDITDAAGARNPSAVHYHFGNVEALIRQVFAERYRNIEHARYARLLKVDDPDPQRRLVALVEAAIYPFMETCLEEEGRLYVRFCLQFASDPRFDLNELVSEVGMESLTLMQERVRACLDEIPAPILNSRLRHAFNISLIQAADFARRLEAGTTRTPEDIMRDSAITMAGYLSARAG